MSGGTHALGTYYDLPNVPYVMFFYNDSVLKELGYSLHGTYWHENFGQPISGLIRRYREVSRMLPVKIREQ